MTAAEDLLLPQLVYFMFKLISNNFVMFGKRF